MSFAEDTALYERQGELGATISSRWEIWGPNGGYLAAIALRAAGLRAGPGHRPAGISCQYLRRGLFGPAALEVEPLKRGRNADCLSVRMLQEERPTLSAQVWTTAAAPDSGPAYCELGPPDVPGPEALDPPEPHPGDLSFWRNFDVRLASPARPGRPDPRGARSARWVGFRDFAPGADAYLDQARALLLIDTMLWPAYWSRHADESAVLAPSLDVSAWFHGESGADDWLLIDSHAPIARGGLIYGEARVWSRDGRLLASGGSNMLVLPTA
jgi:acyl-CoA thioesterase II